MEPSNNPEADSPSIGPTGQAFSWSALLEAYRTGSRNRWSGVLIEGLGPWLTAARRRLVAVPPYYDEEDIAQQLVLEVLRSAAKWRPRCEDCWIPRKLVEAAERRVRKSLAREKSAPTAELDDQLHASEGAEPAVVLDTPIGRASADDLRLIYRVRVLGEPVVALAKEAGVTPRQMRQRVWAARERARAPIADSGDNA